MLDKIIKEIKSKIDELKSDIKDNPNNDIYEMFIKNQIKAHESDIELIKSYIK